MKRVSTSPHVQILSLPLCYPDIFTCNKRWHYKNSEHTLGLDCQNVCFFANRKCTNYMEDLSAYSHRCCSVKSSPQLSGRYFKTLDLYPAEVRRANNLATPRLIINGTSYLRYSCTQDSYKTKETLLYYMYSYVYIIMLWRVIGSAVLSNPTYCTVPVCREAVMLPTCRVCW